MRSRIAIRVFQHAQDFLDNRVDTLISHAAMAENLITTMTESTPLLAVSEHKRSGLILCKPFHAEFAGPGAAVGTLVDFECVVMIAIGSPEIIELVSHEERQRAYSRRIQWMRWLQKITDHSDPVQRVEKLFSGLEAFFGNLVLACLSDEVLALLAGVLPQTVAVARSQYRRLGSTSQPETGPSVVVLNSRTLSTVPGVYGPGNISASYIKALYNLPCSA